MIHPVDLVFKRALPPRYLSKYSFSEMSSESFLRYYGSSDNPTSFVLPNRITVVLSFLTLRAPFFSNFHLHSFISHPLRVISAFVVVCTRIEDNVFLA